MTHLKIYITVEEKQHLGTVVGCKNFKHGYDDELVRD